MRVLACGTLLTLTAFVIHVVLWRVRMPQRHTQALLRIFLGTALLGLLACPALRWLFPDLAVWLPAGLAESAHVLLFVMAMMAAYIISYSALEADSPTLVMVQRILAAGRDGIAPEVFIREMNDDLLVQPRLDDLVRDNMAVLEGGRYRPTPKGRAMAGLFTFFRAVLGAEKGG